MWFSDNQKKFVAILDKKVPLWQQLNALGHMATGIGNLGDADELRFHDYRDADDGSHPAISHYPFIVLKADNSNKIKRARAAAIEAWLLYNDFTASMIGDSSEDQLRQTQEVSEEDMEYWGLVLFGEADKLDPITKKFSLFQ